MATTNNVVIPNVPRGSGVKDAWPHFWAGTRAAKKAGWKITASADGTTKTVSDDPELDEWGAGAITNAGASDASTGAIAGGRMTVTTTSTTNFVDADKGRFLHLDAASSAGNNHYHQIEEVVDDQTVRVDARRTAFTPVASDASNGSIEWEIVDPTTESRPTALDTVQAWILMEGPSTLKIPITAEPVDGASGFTFIRGENITQATSSAEGEVLGYVFDSVSSTGYMVVLPRVIGSGGDPFGWGTGNVITGGTSGATVTQVGAVLEYRQQVVLHKETVQHSGHMYVQCIEPVGESADSFLTLAGAAGCTATTQPGGGGSGNAFPSIGYTSIGNVDSATGDIWIGSSAGNGQSTNGQIIAVDVIWESGYSADGTWAVYSSMASSGSGSTFEPGNYAGRGIFFLEDTEPGDLDPYVCFGSSSNASALYAATNRTTANETTNSNTWQPNCASQRQNGITFITHWKGWQRRGLGTDDDYSDFEIMTLWAFQTNLSFDEDFLRGGDNDVTEPVQTKSSVPLRIGSMASARKLRKGTVRHLQMVGFTGAAANTTYDGGKFIQLHADAGAFVAGPWDETTIPTST